MAGNLAVKAEISSNEVDIFWLKRPLLFPENTVQYLRLPMSGWKNPSKITNFRYILTVPAEIELLTPPWRLNQEFSGSLTASLYPTKIAHEKTNDGRNRYTLSYAGVGITGVSLWLSGKDRYLHRPLIDIGNSEEWTEYRAEYFAEDLQPRDVIISLMRWPALFGSTAVEQSYGTVDLDQVEIQSEGSYGWETNFSCNFKEGLPQNVSSTASLTFEREGEHGFMRLSIPESQRKIQQKMVLGTIVLRPQTKYLFKLRARSRVLASAPEYVWAPVFLRLKESPQKELRLSCHYEFEEAGTAVRCSEEELPIKVVPRLPKTPRKLQVAIWSQAEEGLGFQTEDVQNALIDITKAAGVKAHFTKLVSSPWHPSCNGNVESTPAKNPLEAKLRKAGLQIFPYVGSELATGLKAYLQENPEFHAMSAVGKPAVSTHGNESESMLCPQKMLSNQCDFWQKWLIFLTKAAEINHWDGVFYDYEIGSFLGLAYDGKNFRLKQARCFCPECVEAFRKFVEAAKLEEVTAYAQPIQPGYPYAKLSGAAGAILSQQPLAWCKFRGHQTAEYWDSIRKAVREANPAAEFYLYSGSVCFVKGNRWRDCEFFGVYPPEAGRVIDVYCRPHWPLTGLLGRADVELMRSSLGAQTKRRVPVLSAISNWDQAPRYVLAKNHLVEAIAYCHADGVQIYIWLPTFDAQTWSLVREGVELVANFEEFFVNGTRTDYLVRLDKPLPYAVWIKGDDRAIFVFNDSPHPQNVRISQVEVGDNDGNRVGTPVPFRYEAYDFESGRRFSNPAEIETVIAAHDLIAIHLKAR
ncbi:MAG: hypothetical protein KJ964_02980 [Verrucomicrobia bacterium]|nr:hypothetical protein [Verrucomicrobiota bacterium]MBU1734173.1 hypothetical protein [Verrucomicrobiota bacterium]MBU1856509.1 hypothetical protein [Verrucomicrobiota bacterium]